MNKLARGVSWKRVAASAHDAIMASFALLVGLLARYDLQDLPPRETVAAWMLGFALVAAIVFRLFGLGRGMWRFASITDLRAIVGAATTAVVAFLIAGFMLDRLEGMPRLTPLIAWFVLIVLLGAPRLGYRALKDGGLFHVRPRDREPAGVEHVLIIGSASEADRVIRTYGLERSQRYKVEGIVDYRPHKRGRDVRGVPIIGEVAEIEEIVKRLSRGGVSIGAALVAAPRTDIADLSALATAAARVQLPLRRVVQMPITGEEPNLQALTVEDLLGRAPVKLNLQEVRALVEGRIVLVTGAGGSIGSEVVRQVASYGPSRVVLVDSSEFALYEIDREISERHPGMARPVIANVRDRQRLLALMREEMPSVVFHAAALKHVPLVEANPCEGVMTNVIGTRNVADAAIAANADAVVVISTDKAIRPTSVMGATKRAAECYCQALDVSGVHTRFITVRFGNVLGSTGSVVPLFKRQILAGGPVTVTHPDMKRYFMTIKEATELVLQAAGHGIGRPEQRGRIMVLDMGEPVRILDLARTMIVLAGLRPDDDIEIAFTGLRPGEKLFEELFDASEPITPSGVDGVLVAAANLLPLSETTARIEALAAAAARGHVSETRRLLATLVPELSFEAPPVSAKAASAATLGIAAG